MSRNLPSVQTLIERHSKARYLTVNGQNGFAAGHTEFPKGADHFLARQVLARSLGVKPADYRPGMSH